MSTDRIPVMIPWLGEEEAAAASAAVLSGWVAQGPRVAAFLLWILEKQPGGAYGIPTTTQPITRWRHVVNLQLGIRKPLSPRVPVLDHAS